MVHKRLQLFYFSTNHIPPSIPSYQSIPLFDRNEARHPGIAASAGSSIVFHQSPLILPPVPFPPGCALPASELEAGFRSTPIGTKQIGSRRWECLRVSTLHETEFLIPFLTNSSETPRSASELGGADTKTWTSPSKFIHCGFRSVYCPPSDTAKQPVPCTTVRIYTPSMRSLPSQHPRSSRLQPFI